MQFLFIFFYTHTIANEKQNKPFKIKSCGYFIKFFTNFNVHQCSRLKLSIRPANRKDNEGCTIYQRNVSAYSDTQAFSTASRISWIFELDFERRGRSTLDNNTPHVDGSVTNYESSKRDAVLGVSPSRLPSHPLHFLNLFACPSTTGVVHATTAKINILEIKYERDSAVPRAPSYTSGDSKFYSSAHTHTYTHRGRERYSLI